MSKEKEQIRVKRRETPVKKRGGQAYETKVRRIKKWYAQLVKCREREIVNPNADVPIFRKELKPLDFYINKIKKPN